MPDLSGHRMLVLTRKLQQSIMIGDEIEIVVLEVRGEGVRLGIRAPKTVTVHRKEVFDLIRDENAGAAAVRPEDLASALDFVVPASEPESTESDAK